MTQRLDRANEEHLFALRLASKVCAAAASGDMRQREEFFRQAYADARDFLTLNNVPVSGPEPEDVELSKVTQ